MTSVPVPRLKRAAPNLETVGSPSSARRQEYVYGRDEKALEQRAELEEQLRSLIDTGDVLQCAEHDCGDRRARPPGEQTALQIEELQAAIAKIDEALRNASQA